MRRPSAFRRKKLKSVSYQLITPESESGQAMYPMLARIVADYHEDLVDARIALAWCFSWKADVDGRIVLGQCKKASDLDRELAAYDFIILLNRTFWSDADVSDAQRRALLDHELCHGALKLDPETGEPVEDERGRKVYRLRKHDLEEFTDIVERHGLYKRDLEAFAAALYRAGLGPFVPCETCRDTPHPGWREQVDLIGNRALARCACWVNWSQRRRETASA